MIPTEVTNQVYFVHFVPNQIHMFLLVKTEKHSLYNSFPYKHEPLLLPVAIFSFTAMDGTIVHFYHAEVEIVSRSLSQ